MLDSSTNETSLYRFEPDFRFTYRHIRERVLDLLLRDFSIINNNSELITSLKEPHFRLLCERVSLPSVLPSVIIERFLKEVLHFRAFLRNCEFKWHHDSQKLYRSVKIYLHKVYHIAPVFDFNRARENLKILHQHLNKIYFWPQFTTQIAIIIFVTDKNDKHISEDHYLLQKNIRTLCSCSAYAFHRTRNILNI